MSTRQHWVPVIERSGDELRARLESTDIHHRSQLETYAGLNGWSVPDILGRRAEEIGVRRRSETHVQLAAERRLFLARWRSLIGELAA